MGSLIDLTGQTFDRWTVLGPGDKPGGFGGSAAYYNQSWWLCRCSCAAQTKRPIAGITLRQHTSRSCGCLLKESNDRRRGTSGRFKTTNVVFDESASYEQSSGGVVPGRNVDPGG